VVAGYKGELFADPKEAYKMLYAYTKGLPRDAIKSALSSLLSW
jgi:hypothetical protein